jgi:methylated-DNA-protein-cysteine methyltransferase-like protein
MPRLKSVKPSGKKDESFFELVYEVARQIPKGRVTSYGAIAACLGTRLSARMVGWAMNGADKINPKVSCTQGCESHWYVEGQTSFFSTRFDGKIIKERRNKSKER